MVGGKQNLQDRWKVSLISRLLYTWFEVGVGYNFSKLWHFKMSKDRRPNKKDIQADVKACEVEVQLPDVSWCLIRLNWFLTNKYNQYLTSFCIILLVIYYRFTRHPFHVVDLFVSSLHFNVSRLSSQNLWSPKPSWHVTPLNLSIRNGWASRWVEKEKRKKLQRGKNNYNTLLVTTTKNEAIEKEVFSCSLTFPYFFIYWLFLEQ